MSVRLRRATLEDMPVLRALWLDFLDEQASMDDRFERSLDAAERWGNDFPLWVNAPDRCLLVATEDAVVVGFLAAQFWHSPPIYLQERIVHLNEVYVKPSARGQGIGSLLVSAIRTWSQEEGAHRLQLVMLAENEPARTFWIKQKASPLALTLTIALEPDAPPETPSRPIGFS